MNMPINSHEEPNTGAAVAAPCIHVVDDELLVRNAISRLLISGGYTVSAFDSAEAFLAAHDPLSHGCLVLDIEMPGLGGLGLQQALEERGCHLPTIFMTGHADVPKTIRAMKHGAFEFFVKPVEDAVLFSAVERALKRDRALIRQQAERRDVDGRLATLTPRETEVLIHVMAGRMNKQIASDLGASEKTVKVHRARGMKKMSVRSAADLVRLVERTHPVELDCDD